MKWKWWEKTKPDRTTVDLPIKDALGNVVGRIIIDRRGVFVGNIDSVSFQEKIAVAQSHGFVDSVTITAIMQRPTPPWKRGS